MWISIDKALKDQAIIGAAWIGDEWRNVGLYRWTTSHGMTGWVEDEHGDEIAITHWIPHHEQPEKSRTDMKISPDDLAQKVVQLQAERDAAMDAAIDARGDTAHAVHQANQLRRRIWELEEALAQTRLLAKTTTTLPRYQK